MKLYRITGLPYNGVAVEGFQRDMVYPADSLFRLTNLPMGRDYVGDLPSVGIPTTINDVPPFCDRWIHFLQSSVAKDLGAPADITKPLLRALHDAVWRMRDRPALPSTIKERPVVRYSDLGAGVEVLRTYRDWCKAQLPQPLTPPVGESINVPDNYADFRDGPDGPLLTPKHCWERYGVSDSVLSKEAKKDPNIRRKNPAGGSSFVYRYDVVSRIANRKRQGE